MRWVSNFHVTIERAWARTGRGAAQPTAAFALLMAALCLGATPVESAVRVCGERTTSGPHEAETETQARAAAIAAWAKRAAGTGETAKPQPAWRIASSRTVACRRVDGGKVSCEAAARACLIQQKPPEGVEPLQRRPKPKGPALEV